MTRMTRFSILWAALFSFTALVGCEQGLDVEDTPEQSAQEAFGIDEGGDTQQTTIERQDDVIVRDTTEVIDPDTGQTVKTEETETPVTVTEEKTIETDVNVDTGESTTKVE